jgi:hypothetical protein
MYVHGLNQQLDPVEPSSNMTWLDYLIISNPQGVMKVLAGYGYTGYLAPENEAEMYEVAHEIIEKYEDQAVIDLLKNHPLYAAIEEICTEEKKIVVPFKNASGTTSNFVTTIRTINLKLLIENALIIIGAFFIAGKLWEYITKKD